MRNKSYEKMLDTAGQEFKDAFVGWSVVSVGMTGHYTWEAGDGKTHDGHVEGGLTFILHKNGMLRKIILGYTELGEWIEHQEELT